MGGVSYIQFFLGFFEIFVTLQSPFRSAFPTTNKGYTTKLVSHTCKEFPSEWIVVDYKCNCLAVSAHT